MLDAATYFHLHVYKTNYRFRMVTSYEPSGRLPPEARISPVSFADEASRSIATPPGWDASPSQLTSQHFVRFP